VNNINELYGLIKNYQSIMEEKEKMVLNNLGLCVKSLRTARNLTQQELSMMIGLNRSSVTNIELGKQDTPLSTIVRISCALDCELNDLLELEDKK
jgi:transcriptional regulator with XRE-family HTH domain